MNEQRITNSHRPLRGLTCYLLVSTKSRDLNSSPEVMSSPQKKIYHLMEDRLSGRAVVGHVEKRLPKQSLCEMNPSGMRL